MNSIRKVKRYSSERNLKPQSQLLRFPCNQACNSACLQDGLAILDEVKPSKHLNKLARTKQEIRVEIRLVSKIVPRHCLEHKQSAGLQPLDDSRGQVALQVVEIDDHIERFRRDVERCQIHRRSFDLHIAGAREADTFFKGAIIYV